MIAVVFN